jgi:hypothetical protein
MRLSAETGQSCTAVRDHLTILASFYLIEPAGDMD